MANKKEEAMRRRWEAARFLPILVRRGMGLTILIMTVLTGCSRLPEKAAEAPDAVETAEASEALGTLDIVEAEEATDTPEPGSIPLTMGADVSGKKVRLAGETVAAVINNTVPGAFVQMADSRGAPSDLVNLLEGELDMVMVDGKTARDALLGTGIYESEEKMEELRVLGACYPTVSCWTARKDSGMIYVHQLEGKAISAGTEGSATAMATKEVLPAAGIDGEDTTIWWTGLSEGADGLKKGWADGAHSFSEIPVGAFSELAAETDLTVLSYTDSEIQEILLRNPCYYEARIPAGTYHGQEEEVVTWGIKNLLVCREDMDPELAWEIARALDLNGPVYASGHQFMSSIGDKEFLCTGLPIPLHQGARAYYEELGYLENESRKAEP